MIWGGLARQLYPGIVVCYSGGEVDDRIPTAGERLTIGSNPPGALAAPRDELRERVRQVWMGGSGAYLFGMKHES